MLPSREAAEKFAMPQYKRPPITEAVIEIRFGEPLPKKSIDAVHTRLSENYEFSEPISAMDIELDVPQRKAKFDSKVEGYKLSSNDRTDILQITPVSMACSRLAPYNGWELFRKRATSNWKIWKKIIGYRTINRLGVRYINRIDIPAPGAEKIRIEDYLTVYPQYPEPGLMVALTNYTMQIVGPFDEEKLKLIINSRAVRSPLEGHFSTILDIDVLREVDVPQKDNKIWKEFDSIRTFKNRVFEACVTDNTRKLFEK